VLFRSASPAAPPAKPGATKTDAAKSSQAKANPTQANATAASEAPRLSRAERRRLAREQRAAEKAAQAALTPPLTVDRPGAAKVAKTPVGDELSLRAEQAYQGALAAYSAGRTQESRGLVSEALQLQPRHVAARQLLIRQSVEQGQASRAIELLRDGTRLMPEQAAWWTLLAQLELGRGKLAEARSVIDATPAGARNTTAFNSLAGAIAQRQGDSDAAADFYRQALRLDSRSGRDWVGLALALEKQGHGGEAQEALRRALATQTLNDELLQLARQRLARHEAAAPVASQ
jgi:MSHA biogenesis protein MshN